MVVMLDEVTKANQRKVRLKETVINIYTNLCEVAGLGQAEKAEVQLSLTDFFAEKSYTESERVAVTWLLYHFGMLRKLHKLDRQYFYEVRAVLTAEVTDEAIEVALAEYRTYKRLSKKKRRNDGDTHVAPVTVSEPKPNEAISELPLSPVVAEQIAALILEVKERDEQIKAAREQIMSLQAELADLKARPVVSVEEQLAAAIAVLLKR